MYEVIRDQIYSDFIFSAYKNALQEKPTFPKFSSYTKPGENTHFIEFALAGYKKESISVTLDKVKGYITISGKTLAEDKRERKYLHQGIAKRDFSSSFFVGKNMVAKNASFSNGLLTIELEEVIPEEQRPQVVEIT